MFLRWSSLNYTIKLERYPKAVERKNHRTDTSKDISHQEISLNCETLRPEKLLWTQLLTAEERVVCGAYSQSDFSFLLGENHRLDISEANGNGCVTGKMTASNQPCIWAKHGVPRRGTLQRSREGCSSWVPDGCSDLALPSHNFLVRGYTEGHFSSSHFGRMSTRKSQKWTESWQFWVMRRAEKCAVLGINDDAGSALLMYLLICSLQT